MSVIDRSIDSVMIVINQCVNTSVIMVDRGIDPGVIVGMVN